MNAFKSFIKNLIKKFSCEVSKKLLDRATIRKISHFQTQHKDKTQSRVNEKLELHKQRKKCQLLYHNPDRKPTLS